MSSWSGDFVAAIEADPLQQVITIVLAHRGADGAFYAANVGVGEQLVFNRLQEGVRPNPTLVLGDQAAVHDVLRALHAEIERVLVITHDDPAVDELRSSLEVERKRVDQMIDATIGRIKQ